MKLVLTYFNPIYQYIFNNYYLLKIINEIFMSSVHTTQQKARVYFTYNTSLFGLDTFLVLISHVWLMATLLDSRILTITLPASLPQLCLIVDSLTIFTLFWRITMCQALYSYFLILFTFLHTLLLRAHMKSFLGLCKYYLHFTDLKTETKRG